MRAAFLRKDLTLLLPLSVVVLLSAIHFYYLVRYGINIPFSDDYVEILNNVSLILDSNSISEAVQHLLHGNGYSKPITLRLISLLHISLFDEINFRYLVITGNIFLLFVCFIFILSSWNINRYLMVSISCFIFQPQYWEAIYQSTLSNSVFSCLFFSLGSIYCVIQNRTYYHVISLIFAVIAQYSFGNGILVYPILLAVTMYQRNIRFSAIICITMILFTYLYMLGNTVSYSAGQHMGLLPKLKLCSVWLLEFVGSSVGYSFSAGYGRDIAGRTFSIIVGTLTVLFYAVIFKKKYYEKNLLLFSFMTFFILTSVLTAALRYNSEVPGASRYQIQSALCVLTALIIIVDLYAGFLTKYIIILLTVVFPLMFALVTYKTNLSNVSNHRTRLVAGLISWQKRGTGLTIWSGEEAAGKLLVRSRNRNLYKMPTGHDLTEELWKQ